jgi:hypothetical protein
MPRQLARALSAHRRLHERVPRLAAAAEDHRERLGAALEALEALRAQARDSEDCEARRLRETEEEREAARRHLCKEVSFKYPPTAMQTRFHQMRRLSSAQFTTPPQKKKKKKKKHKKHSRTHHSPCVSITNVKSMSHSQITRNRAVEEALRLVTRALVPSLRRAEDLAAQKRLLTREVIAARQEQAEATDLMHALLGTLGSESATSVANHRGPKVRRRLLFFFDFFFVVVGSQVGFLKKKKKKNFNDITKFPARPSSDPQSAPRKMTLRLAAVFVLAANRLRRGHSHYGGRARVLGGTGRHPTLAASGISDSVGDVGDMCLALGLHDSCPGTSRCHTDDPTHLAKRPVVPSDPSRLGHVLRLLAPGCGDVTGAGYCDGRTLVDRIGRGCPPLPADAGPGRGCGIGGSSGGGTPIALIRTTALSIASRLRTSEEARRRLQEDLQAAAARLEKAGKEYDTSQASLVASMESVDSLERAVAEMSQQIACMVAPGVHNAAMDELREARSGEFFLLFLLFCFLFFLFFVCFCF